MLFGGHYYPTYKDIYLFINISLKQIIVSFASSHADQWDNGLTSI